MAAALGRPCGWEQWSGVPTHAGHMVEARLVVPVAMGRGGSKRSVVAAGSGRTVTTGWTWEGGPPRHRQQKPGNKISTPAGQMVVALRKRWAVMGRWGLRAAKSATRDGNEQNSGHRHLIEES